MGMLQLRAQSSPRAVFAMYWTASCLAGSYCISSALRAGAGELASDWWTITDEAVPPMGSNDGEATDATLTFALEGLEGLDEAAMTQLRVVRVLLHLLSSKVRVLPFPSCVQQSGPKTDRKSYPTHGAGGLSRFHRTLQHSQHTPIHAAPTPPAPPARTGTHV